MHGADRRRPAWHTLPTGLRTTIVEEIGGAYVSDSPSHGGFGAGYAGVVQTTEGRAFVKAVSGDGHGDSLRFLRQELDIVFSLPRTLFPAYRSSIDTDDGAALILDPIDGEHPGTPWTDGQLDAIAAAMAELAITAAPASLPDATEALVPRYTRWRDIACDETLCEGLPHAIEARLPVLVDIEREFSATIAGGAIMHNDLRADNILLRDGAAHLFDWPHAMRAAPWADLPVLLPSIESGGGPVCESAWQIFRRHGAPPPEALLPITVGFASFLWHGQSQPEIPEIPGLRRFQRRQARAALRWISTMLQ